MGQNIHVFITYFKKIFWIYHLICSNSFSKSHEFCNLSAIFLLSGKNIQLQVHVKSIYHWNVHNSTFFRNFGPTSDTSKWDRDLNIWQFMYQPHKQKLKEVHIKVFKVCYKFSIILICNVNMWLLKTGTQWLPVPNVFFLTSNWKSDTMFHRHTFPMMSPPATEKMTPMTLTTMVFRRTTCGTLTPLR